LKSLPGIPKPDTSRIQRYFTDAYYHFPHELIAEILEASFEFTDIISVEAFAHLVPDLGNKLQDEKFRMSLLSTINLVEKYRAILGMASHFLGIGTRILHCFQPDSFQRRKLCGRRKKLSLRVFMTNPCMDGMTLNESFLLSKTGYITKPINFRLHFWSSRFLLTQKPRRQNASQTVS